MNLSRGVGEMGDLRVEEIDEVADFKGKKDEEEDENALQRQKNPDQTKNNKGQVLFLVIFWNYFDILVGLWACRKSRNIGDKK